jgi:hypothetical protein
VRFFHGRVANGLPARIGDPSGFSPDTTWTTTYFGDALDALRADGYNVPDEVAAHLTPAQHDHINFYGTYSFDVETELQRKGHRPLRSPAA